jgi:putative membrane protein
MPEDPRAARSTRIHDLRLPARDFTLLAGLPVCALAFILPDAAHAHAVTLPVTPDTLWQNWSFDLWVVLPLLVSHWLYGRGVLRLWASAGLGRGISMVQAGCFLAGELALVAALLSPLDPLGSTLQSAHMTQHMILIALAPPLLLAGRPDAAFAWAIGPRGAQLIAQVKSALGWLARPFPATALHAAAIWGWHAPQVYHAALENDFVHWLEHLSFFGTGLLIWSVFLAGMRRRSMAPAAMAASFVTILHSGFLAALFTFSPRHFYPWYDGRAQLWGLTPLADQQLAGLIMWVPAMPLYLGVVLMAAHTLLGSGDEAPAGAFARSPAVAQKRSPLPG